MFRKKPFSSPLAGGDEGEGDSIFYDAIIVAAMYNDAGTVSMDTWHIYIIRCGDGSLYTGISTDPARRFVEHVRGGPRAARYLKGRGPLRLVFSREAGGRSAALRLERRIKRMPRADKLTLIEDSRRADVLFGDVR